MGVILISLMRIPVKFKHKGKIQPYNQSEWKLQTEYNICLQGPGIHEHSPLHGMKSPTWQL